MANVRFLYDDVFDGLTTAQTSASSEVTTLPHRNVLQQFVGKKWRSSGAATGWVKFDLGLTTTIRQVALFGHNLTSGATAVIQARNADGTTGQWAAPAWDTTISLYTAEKKGNVFFAAQRYRWWRLSINDAGNSDGYVQVGRFKAGDYYEPAQNFRSGWERELYDPSETDKAEGLQRYHNVRDAGWKVRMGWHYASTTVQGEMVTMIRDVGSHEAFVLAVDPDNEPLRWTHYVELRTPLRLAMSLLSNADMGQLEFQEAF